MAQIVHTPPVTYPRGEQRCREGPYPDADVADRLIFPGYPYFLHLAIAGAPHVADSPCDDGMWGFLTNRVYGRSPEAHCADTRPSFLFADRSSYRPTRPLLRLMRFIWKGGVYARDAISTHRRADCAQLVPDGRKHLDAPISPRTSEFAIDRMSLWIPRSNIRPRPPARCREVGSYPLRGGEWRFLG